MSSDIKSAKSKVEKKKKKKVSEVSIKIAKKGHVVTHHHDSSGPEVAYYPSEQHVFGSDEGDALMAHVMKHARVKTSGSKAKEEEDQDDEA